MTLNNTDELYSMDTEELLNLFETMIEEGDIDEEENERDIALIKEGILLNIPIIYIIQEWYTDYPQSGSVHIQGHGHYPLEKFHEDKRKREALMRKIIIENLHQEELTKPREEQL